MITTDSELTIMSVIYEVTLNISADIESEYDA